MKTGRIPTWLQVLVLVVVAMFLAACGPKADSGPDPENPEKKSIETEYDDEDVIDDYEVPEDDDEEYEDDEEDEEEE